MQYIELISDRNHSPRIINLRINGMTVRYPVLIFINQANDSAMPSPFPEGSNLIDPGIHLSRWCNTQTGNTRSQILG